MKIIWSKYYSISNFILCCPFTDRSRETKESTIPWLSPTRWRETFKLRLILYDSNPCTPMGSEESISQYRFSSFTIKLVHLPKIEWSQKTAQLFISFPASHFLSQANDIHINCMLTINNKRHNDETEKEMLQVDEPRILHKMFLTKRKEDTVTRFLTHL